MEMEETLIDKNEDAIFENGLLELMKNNNRLYIFNLFFSHRVNFFLVWNYAYFELWC
jgi:hypothetical protein